LQYSTARYNHRYRCRSLLSIGPHHLPLSDLSPETIGSASIGHRPSALTPPRATYPSSLRRVVTALVALRLVLLATLDDASCPFITVSGLHRVRPLGRALVGRGKLAAV